jgi:hypothetical protein
MSQSSDYTINNFLPEYTGITRDEKGALIMYKNRLSVAVKINPNSNIIKFNPKSKYTHVVKYVLPNKENTVQQINLIPITQKEFTQYLKKRQTLKIGGKNKKTKTKRLRLT